MNKLNHIDFIGLGTGKAGSTWIADMLSKHPDICMSNPKEIHYFNTNHPSFKKYKNPNKNFSISWFNNHFSHCSSYQLIGEFSTGYLHDPDAAQNIYSHFPNAKLIVCLRNPIDRAYSQYWMQYNYFKDELNTSFEEAIANEPCYLERGLYYQHLQRFLQYFNQSQLHIVFIEDIHKHPQYVLNHLYDFLDIRSDYIPNEIFEKSNSTQAMKFKFIVDLMRNTSNLLLKYRLGWVLYGLKKIGIKHLLKEINSTSYSYPPMNQDTRIKLQQYYKKDIYNLEKLLNKDLSHWT